MQPRDRARFGAGELATVLSHYDLGIIESITDFPRGSRRSPKVGIVCDKGKFLLKRRSIDRAHPDRVRFVHGVQRHLASANLPVPILIKTRNRQATFLLLRDHVYELFEFVPGQPFGQTPEEAREAGAMLARVHDALNGLTVAPTDAVSRGDYHDAAGVRTGLCAIGSTLSSHDSFTGDEAELAGLVQFLLSAYDRAAKAGSEAGVLLEPVRMIHSDWHPGNLLFRKGEIVAVIDYDTLKLSHRIVDIANGTLQFSILGRGDPASWPDDLDLERYAAFLLGYEAEAPLTGGELRLIHDLMVEALIAECVPPITETGSVGRWAGYRVLQMVRRKITWLSVHGERLRKTYEQART